VALCRHNNGKLERIKKGDKMQNKEFSALAQSLTGLMTCQTLLLQYLIKKGTVDKAEISNALDFLIDDFNKKEPSQAITLIMTNIRAGLDKDLPDFPPPPAQRPKSNPPAWFRGIIDGGKK
jgi:hypothetical protein